MRTVRAGHEKLRMYITLRIFWDRSAYGTDDESSVDRIRPVAAQTQLTALFSYSSLKEFLTLFFVHFILTIFGLKVTKDCARRYSYLMVTSRTC
jgi:hypothetical protein